MGDTPSHRWFSFSLRTWFAFFTIICLVTGWVAYQLNWIRQRHACLTTSQVVDFTDSISTDAPSFLWLFGERGYPRLVVLRKNVSASERSALEALYPESEISFVDDWKAE